MKQNILGAIKKYPKKGIIIAYQKIINLLDNTPNQASTFRPKMWVQINYELCEMYNKNSQVKFKTSMIKSSFCDYNDAYILENNCWSRSR